MPHPITIENLGKHAYKRRAQYELQYVVVVLVVEWHNRIWSPFEQYIKYDEIDDWRMKWLLDVYGRFFDDCWCYRVGGRSLKVVIRQPIVYGFQSRIPCEKYKPAVTNGQLQLV